MRKHLLLSLLIGFSALTLIAADADARRMGGGKSIGRQSQPVEQRQAPAPSNAAPQQNNYTNQPAAAPNTAQQPATPPKQPNRLLGALGGIAAAVGIGALLSHFGLGGALASGMGSLLLIALVAMVGLFLFRRLSGQQQQPAYGAPQPGPFSSPAPMPRTEAQPIYNPSLTAAANAMAEGKTQTEWSIPSDMDVENFLHFSKVHFVRLQASWDSGNLEDIREFTTPEMFAELKLQINERGASDNHTDVVRVEAELLGVETTPREEIASIRFSGELREGKGAPVETFEEVWNLVRPISRKTGWVLAGIQQTP